MLTDKRLAILGAGMMGGALGRGLIRSGLMQAAHISLYDLHVTKANELAAELGGPGARVFATAREAVDVSEIILLSVKPGVIAPILETVAPSLTANHLVISIAAGVPIHKMEALIPTGVPVIRAMPNTPALVGEGMTALAPGLHANEEHLAIACDLFRAVGKAVVVDEKLMDAVTGLSGSGPAYVYLLIEALLDGGVKAGLNRETARLLAAQTVFGAAKLVLESTEHPAQLKDNVTTPGGTTIAALAVLERAGFRIALMDAIEAAANRSRELS